MSTPTLNTCEGCEHCQFPGIRWPAAPDGCVDQSFAERCDYCERFDGDIEAVLALVEFLGGDIRIGCAMRSCEVDEVWNDAVRWFPAGASAEDIATSDLFPFSGWSLCIDHEARASDGCVS